MNKLAKKHFQRIVPKSTLKALTGKSKKKKRTNDDELSTSDASSSVGNVTTRQKVELQLKKESEEEFVVESLSFDDFLAQETTVSPSAVPPSAVPPTSPQLEEQGKSIAVEDVTIAVKKEPSLLDQVLLNKMNESTMNLCFEKSIEVVYSPINSQLVLTDEAMKMDDYAYIGMKLVNTIRSAFPNVSSSKFESEWNNCAKRSFPDPSSTKKPVDHALLNLMVREKMIQKGRYKHFSRENFSSKKEYEQWKEKELQLISFLRNRAKTNREQRFLFRVNIDLLQLVLDAERKDLVPRQEVFFKVRASGQPELLHTTSNRRAIRNKNNQLTLTIEPDLPMCDILTADQHIIIHIYRRGVLGNERFGEVKIPVSSLLDYFVPVDCSWAIQPFSAEYDIYQNEKGKLPTENRIGRLFASFYMQIHRSPEILEEEKYSQRMITKCADLDYHLLFDILLHQFIEANKIGKERDDRKLVDFYQTWILEEFCNQHGISEVYKRISMLREIISHNELLLMFIQEFKESFDFVNSNIQEKFVVTTQYEGDLIRSLKNELTGKLESVIFKFISEFDTGRSRVLRVAIDLLEYISLKDGSMTKEEFSKKFKATMLDALRKNYSAMSKKLGNTTDNMARALMNAVEAVKEAMYDIMYYSDAVPAYCKWEARALKIFLEELNNDFDSLKERKELSGYWVLTYCKKMDELNDEIRENYSKKELKRAKIELFNVRENSQKYEDEYIGELAVTLNTHMNRSLSLDKWERCNEDVLHSHSVVDLFTSAFQTLEYISGTDFVTESLLDKYSIVVGECITKYSKHLEQLCKQDMLHVAESHESYQHEINKQSPVPKLRRKRDMFKLRFKTNLMKSNREDESEIGEIMYVTPGFVVKLNNIEASKVQLKDWVRALMDEKSTFRDIDTNMDEEDDSGSESESESMVDESLKNMMRIVSQISRILRDLQTSIALQFKPYIRPALNKVLRITRENMKKSHVKLPEDELRSIYGKQAKQMLNDTFLESILTPNLAILSENIYEGAFLKILAEIFKIIMDECVQILIPFSATQKKGCDCIDVAQECVLRHLVEHVEEYFYGDGEGLSHKTIARQKRFFLQVEQLFFMDTERLIGLCEKLSGLNDNRADVIKYSHVLAILSGRYKRDKTAKRYFKAVVQRS